MDARITRIAAGFGISCDGISPLGKGLINDTWLAGSGNGPRYVLQRINSGVFREPEKVMDNIARVTGHCAARIRARGGDPSREALTVVRSRDGRPFVIDDRGEYWRAFFFLDGAQAPDRTDTATARIVGRAFGAFQNMLIDLPGPRLHETIAGFHHTPGRLSALRQAVDDDRAGRKPGVGVEIDFALQRAAGASGLAGMLTRGDIPERIAHNDAKRDNVLVDRGTGNACVIDLDTVMPGLSILDFGDMVRTGAATVAEDCPDAAGARIDRAIFEGLAAGYLSEARSFLTPAETERLPLAAWTITFEQGVRFLTDFLQGDRYYKTSRPGQNLDRCRTQFALVADMERNMGELQRITKQCLARDR